MRAANVQTSSDWESAYQGNKISLTVVAKPARRHVTSVKSDLSGLGYFAFYAAISVGIVAYIYFLNQQTIIEYITGVKIPVTQESHLSEEPILDN